MLMQQEKEQETENNEFMRFKARRRPEVMTRVVEIATLTEMIGIAA